MSLFEVLAFYLGAAEGSLYLGAAEGSLYLEAAEGSVFIWLPLKYFNPLPRDWFSAGIVSVDYTQVLYVGVVQL
jgi:hypothetical protein